MFAEEIVRLFQEEKLEELEKFVDEIKKDDYEAVAKELSSIEPELLADILPKINKDVSAELFILFPKKLQKYLTENISDIEFEEVADELLDSDVEDNVSTEVLNEIKKEKEWFSYDNQEWIMNNVFSIFMSNAPSSIDCS